jgi:hypothetical protein
MPRRGTEGNGPPKKSQIKRLVRFPSPGQPVNCHNIRGERRTRHTNTHALTPVESLLTRNTPSQIIQQDPASTLERLKCYGNSIKNKRRGFPTTREIRISKFPFDIQSAKEREVVKRKTAGTRKRQTKVEFFGDANDVARLPVASCIICQMRSSRNDIATIMFSVITTIRASHQSPPPPPSVFTACCVFQVYFFLSSSIYFNSLPSRMDIFSWPHVHQSP